MDQFWIFHDVGILALARKLKVKLKVKAPPQIYSCRWEVTG